MPNTFAEKIIQFNKNLLFENPIPKGFQILNPYLNNPETLQVMKSFYNKYYHDKKTRKFIIGINPSRHGAGVTGVPFTDTKRLESNCGIQMKTAHTHEISSVFIYDMIQNYGGAELFYKHFFINSPFPLAIIQYKNGQWLNANYYDNNLLFDAVKPFMIQSLKTFATFGLNTSEVYILGKKNADYIKKINNEIHLFDKLNILEHPRYIQQYKSKEKQFYIDKYLIALHQ